MNQLAVNPQTEQQLAHICAEPPHALLLTAGDGMGKTALARWCIARILGIDESTVSSSPQCKIIAPGEKATSLSIDDIRQLQQFVKLRTVGTARIRRAILIEHADTLTVEAQNALLKLLEEPPADTILILTAAEAHTLLPTIRSRVQTLAINRPDRATLEEFFGAQFAPAAVAQAYFLSGGLPGLLSALLADEKHPLLASVQNAKQLLQEDSFSRLAHLDQYAKQKTEAIRLCNALQRMSQAALEQAAAKQGTAALKRWHGIYKAAYAAEQQLQNNGSTKLVLTQLVLQLSS
ncbi:MAG TPA: AAA family ATPase [Candidatus Saccharimonadales bacterium]|nr:AAA family ATPase [Candidatus Saccharimonadales bacterium]